MARIVHRAWLSIFRKPTKVIILFFTVLLLGVLTSGAISVHQAINNTETNLRRRIPPVATIIQDHDAYQSAKEIHGDAVTWQPLTAAVG